MVLSDNLYISGKLKKSGDIKKNIAVDCFSDNVFLICHNRSSANLLDIYFAPELNKPFVHREHLTVLCLCADKYDAKATCVGMIEKFINQHGSLEGFKENAGGIRWV